MITLSIFSFVKVSSQQIEFGKNRLQYHKNADEWVYYETANFVTYWFGDARLTAQAALQTAEFDFNDLQSLLEHPLSEKIELIVYHDLTDLKTSNLGSDDQNSTTDAQGRPLYQLAYSGGQLASSETKTRVIGNKIFVHFDGNHTNLRTKIREGISGVMLNSMLFGSNLQEIVQNAVLLNLPPWFTDGLLAFCGEEWSSALDDELRDVLASGKFKTFEKLARAYPRLAGHAMWHYVNLHFGRQTVSNLLYLTRINRSVESGFLYVLGGTYKRTGDAAMIFFKKRYAEDAKNLTPPEKSDLFLFKNKKNLPITQLRFSPDGKKLAFVTSDLGRWKIKLYDFEKEKMRLLAKGSFRNAIQTTDFNYPIIAFSPNNQEIALLFEQRDVLKLTKIELKTGKKTHDKIPPDFQRIYSMAFVNQNDLVFSALVKGQSDLFIYKTVTRGTERLTNDFWDDLDASVWNSGEKRGILFASNRPSDTLSAQRLDTILPLGRFDIFYLGLNEASVEPPKSTFGLQREARFGLREGLVKITNTPDADERRPIAVDSSFLNFLGDETGVSARNSSYLEDYLAFHRQIYFLKNGDEWTLEGQFSPEKNGWKSLERAWKKGPDAESGEIKTTRLPIDTSLKLPKKEKLDSVRLTEVWSKRPYIWNQTTYDREIADQTVAVRSGRLAELIRRNGRYQIYIKNAEPRKNKGARLSRWRQTQLVDFSQKNGLDSISFSQKMPDEIASDSTKTELLPNSKIAAGARFQTRFEETETTQRTDNQSVKEDSDELKPRFSGSARGREFDPKTDKIVRFNPSRIVPYRLKFRTDDLKTTVDNSLLFEGLESYAGTPNDFRTPPAGILAKGVFKDLFEDYILSGGVRVPLTFNGAEYFMVFDNKKHRIDRRIALYRKSQSYKINNNNSASSPESQRNRLNTVLGQYEIRYPVDLYTSFRATGTLRQDRSFQLATDDLSLNGKTLTEQRAAIRLSAVFDNTIDIDLNIRTGSRGKFWIEAVKGVQINPEQSQFNLKNGFMTVIGLDARHYQRLDRRSIFATRLAGGTSFGSERILYFLGGVDQSLFPKFNNKIPIPTGDDFAFQTSATSVRGFAFNIRNGNSFAVWNNEIRVPIFKYFSQKPTLGAFWRNFQLVGFFDAGTAWQGKSPYDKENPINITQISNPPTVYVTVNYFRDPIVAGYGFGVRSTLFGFYLRADYGWGIETRRIQKPMLHLAMGVDF
jgi:hypothetical protein